MSISPKQATIIAQAEYALRNNISVVAVKSDGSKSPIGSWQKYQKTHISSAQLKNDFATHDSEGFGLICGEVSGHLEAMDFDNIEAYQDFKAVAKETGLAGIVNRIEDGYLEKSPNGIHWFYRCPEGIEGSKKLAQKQGGYLPDGRIDPKQIKVLIETRGEGGYCIAAPSNGKTHPTGKPYEVVKGNFETIAVITADERKRLHILAECLDETCKPEVKNSLTREGATLHKDPHSQTAGDDFNSKARWDEILVPHGWRLLHDHGGKGIWTRPGTQSNDPHATTNNDGSDRLYVFSTSTTLEANRYYTKFQAHTFLNHNGDFAAAAKNLAAKGFGSPLTLKESSKERKSNTDGIILENAVIPTQNNSKDPRNPGQTKQKYTFQPNIINAKDLLTKKFDPINWVVPEILPEGLTMLASRPKMGKSWLALAMSIAVASGGCVLGKYWIEKPGSVLHLALEDNERRLQSRTMKILDGSEAPATLEFTTEWPKLDGGAVDYLKERIVAKPNIRLVVIDTLARIKPPSKSNQNVYDADYNLVQGLKGLCDTYKIAILLIHHTRKMDSPSEDPLELISGSFGLTGGVDNALVLTRKRGEADAVLSVIGRDTQEKELSLRFDPSRCIWSVMGNAENYSLPKKRKEIVDLLESENEGLTLSELAERTRKSKSALSNILKELLESGLIIQPNGKGGAYKTNITNTLF